MTRALLQQALEVLGCTTDPDSAHYEDQLNAIQALRTELAKPEPAPYRYLSEHNCDGPYKYQFHKDQTTVYWDNCKQVTALFTKEQL